MESLSFYAAKALRILLQRPALRKCKIDRHSKVCSGTQCNSVEMDRFSYIGHDCFLNHVKIGAFCSIADSCKIGGAQHPLGYVSSSPVFLEGRNIMGVNFAAHEDTKDLTTCIGDDVWIGMGCCIKGGVHIGVGSVIGMGSVVTKDVPPYEVWGGNPARYIRKRFDEETTRELLRTRWWEMPIPELNRYAMFFHDPELFIREYQKNNQ